MEGCKQMGHFWNLSNYREALIQLLKVNSPKSKKHLAARGTQKCLRVIYPCKWKATLQEKYDLIIANGTWELTNLLKNCKSVRCIYGRCSTPRRIHRLKLLGMWRDLWQIYILKWLEWVLMRPLSSWTNPSKFNTFLQ